MAGKRYQAKDRKVAKMERTGLVEENVRTGEKSRTSKESTREITFESRSDSGKRQKNTGNRIPLQGKDRMDSRMNPAQE